ncbi:unnamed protein product [Cylicostephanus goldi]|uniref:Uncharacterized protein n=1 Tax=Cylicostephanus goldi TaxID=71465 RepID=A0A3P6S4L2_CYLGO|nr:unnamed protein product [Cylicostephanus goldi]
MFRHEEPYLLYGTDTCVVVSVHLCDDGSPRNAFMAVAVDFPGAGLQDAYTSITCTFFFFFLLLDNFSSRTIEYVRGTINGGVGVRRHSVVGNFVQLFSAVL